jgi:tagatose-6-phosphate ketose/aldose isomerase
MKTMKTSSLPRIIPAIRIRREPTEASAFVRPLESPTVPNADANVLYETDGYKAAGEVCAGVQGLVFMQLLAMFKSLALGITTDNPSPSGKVNRVVKGVAVYPLGD